MTGTTTPPVSLAACNVEGFSFLFYVDPQGEISCVKSPNTKDNQKTSYDPLPVLVIKNKDKPNEKERVKIYPGFKQIAAIRVYYVGTGPDPEQLPTLSELWSDDKGQTWYQGDLTTGLSTAVAPNTSIEATVVKQSDQLKIYYTEKDHPDRIRLAYMPLPTGDKATDESMNWVPAFITPQGFQF